jgi:hypothetical protein
LANAFTKSLLVDGNEHAAAHISQSDLVHELRLSSGTANICETCGYQADCSSMISLGMTVRLRSRAG